MSDKFANSGIPDTGTLFIPPPDNSTELLIRKSEVHADYQQIREALEKALKESIWI